MRNVSYRLISGTILAAASLLMACNAKAQLVASWQLNQASWSGATGEVLDVTGNHDGTAVGGAQTVYDTTFGQVGSFNGSGQYVSVGGSGSLAYNGARTIVAWVDPTSNMGFYGMPIVTGGATSAGDFFGLGGTGGSDSAYGSGAAYHLYVDSWYYGPSPISTIAVTPNQWNFVAITYSGGFFNSNSLNYYVNGAAAGSTAYQMYGYNTDTYTIGGNIIGGTSTAGSFDGMMHDVSIYDTALTPSQITALYNSTNTANTPEPGAFALLIGAAVSGTAAIRRKRNC